MKLKKLESGRSMVEMLGVLAIIGVLSVGGIAGYSLSMRRHRANQIVDLVSKFALDAYSRCQKDLIGQGESFIEDIEHCGIKYFNKADFGELPAGMYELSTSHIEQDKNAGIDIIHISAVFDDDKLCQAVGTLVGSTCDSNNGVHILIKQN